MTPRLSVIIFLFSAVAVAILAVRHPIRVTVVVRRIGTGRTAAEVRSYMESRSWYHEWKACLEKARPDECDAGRFLAGCLLEHTIADSFDWNDSPQGYDVWLERHCEFLDWFHCNESD